MSSEIMAINPFQVILESVMAASEIAESFQQQERHTPDEQNTFMYAIDGCRSQAIHMIDCLFKEAIDSVNLDREVVISHIQEIEKAKANADPNNFDDMTQNITKRFGKRIGVMNEDGSFECDDPTHDHSQDS